MSGDYDDFTMIHSNINYCMTECYDDFTVIHVDTEEHYDVFIISYIAKLSMEVGRIDEKKSVCLMIDEIPFKQATYLCKWSYGKDGEIIFKPQYIRSAAKIYLLLKYPWMKGPKHFADKIMNSGLERECLSIALEVLKTDPNSDFYIEYFDSAVRITADFSTQAC